MLACEAFGKRRFLKTFVNQIIVWRAACGENRPAVIDERQYERRLQTFVFGLDVIGYPVMLNVCVESGYQICLQVQS